MPLSPVINLKSSIAVFVLRSLFASEMHSFTDLMLNPTSSPVSHRIYNIRWVSFSM